VTPGPAGNLKVPAALLSVLEIEASRPALPALGYFVQIPHYVTGGYPSAAVELVRLVSRHLDEEIARARSWKRAGCCSHASTGHVRG